MKTNYWTTKQLETIGKFTILGVVLFGLSNLIESTLLPAFFANYLLLFNLVFAGFVVLFSRLVLKAIRQFPSKGKDYFGSSVSRVYFTIREAFVLVAASLLLGVFFTAGSVEESFQSITGYSGYGLTIVLLYQFDIIRELGVSIFTADKALYQLENGIEDESDSK